LFSLKYNPISHEFDVTRNEEVSTRTGENPETAPDTETESQPQPEPEPEKEVVFRLNVFNTEGKSVGKLELSEEELLNPSSFNDLSNIGVYDDYYFSVWSNKPSRIKIQGDIDGENNLGESGSESEDYSEGIQDIDHMNNVRFKLRTDGLEAVYNKAPKIIIKSKKILTAYAGDEIDYTSDVIVEDDHDETIPTENIKVNVLENNTEDDLVIGKNDINLSVEDSWGRESNIDRKILIINGIDKNTIRIMQENDQENAENNFVENIPVVLSIGFNHSTKKLIVNDYDAQFGPREPYDEPYLSLKIVRPNENGTTQTMVGPVTYNTKHKPSTHSNFLQNLRNYVFEYGDMIEITHHHPKKVYIDGTVTDAREDYTDAIQNPENLINTKFEITKSGLKAVYTNPDTNNTTGNKVIIGPMAPEKFPFKLQIDPAVNRITVVPGSAVHNGILWKYDDDTKVYKFVLIGQDGTEKRRVEFRGRDYGDYVNNTERPNFYLNNLEYDYGDAIYLWHIEPERSIIKGNIKYAREDYSNGVDDPDNMNNVVFKLTQQGVESVYNEAPKIHGVEDIEIFQGEEFDEALNVTYSDDFDNGHLTTNIEGTVDENRLGEQFVTYTATDRWGNTTEVERKVTVRPNLYKNVFKVFSDDNTTEPIFEIGFDSVTGKYRVFNQKNERISSNDLSETAFEIRIIGSNKEIKKKITLTGNDRGNSPQLNEINDVEYEAGDIIRVYRSNLDAISIEGDVTGDIPQSDQILDEIGKFDYMKNTGFKVSNSGLEAVYNQAPQIIGVIEDKTVSKGEVINLLEGIEVNDDIDNLSIQDIAIYINGDLVNVTGQHTFDSLGTYDIEYVLYDSWGRGVLQELTITVESKVRDNEIEVYDSNNNLAFKVTFNTTENKFVLKGNETSTTYNSSSTEDKYFEMVVRDIKGEEKYRVTLNGDIIHDTQQLRQIHQMNFDKYDTIALYGKTANAVKIKGGVIYDTSDNLDNQDYIDGFGNTTRYPLVRFKITDDGIKEMTEKVMSVSGLEAKSIKRGDNIDFLEGVIVNVQDTNNEDYKIEVNSDNLNKLKEGQYTVTYTVTNSWGQELIQTRTITVEPRTELEGVKLNVKNNNGEVILTIGFDSIERKLRVINYRENSTIDSRNTNLAFAINAYDSLGNTLGTIELDGNQRIDQSLINRLNNFAYIEGYRISIWAKKPNEHLDVEGTRNVSNKVPL
ncbi:MAG: DUF5011 domain-containing protein, partial [Romboutsia sp.]|nr:DUF5011 domain-containing protein [Romboutsia sp.]